MLIWHLYFDALKTSFASRALAYIPIFQVAPRVTSATKMVYLNSKQPEKKITNLKVVRHTQTVTLMLLTWHPSTLSPYNSVYIQLKTILY